MIQNKIVFLEKNLFVVFEKEKFLGKNQGLRVDLNNFEDKINCASPTFYVQLLHILREAFKHADHKSTKKTDSLTVFFALLGSARVKILRKHVGEIDP